MYEQYKSLAEIVDEAKSRVKWAYRTLLLLRRLRDRQPARASDVGPFDDPVAEMAQLAATELEVLLTQAADISAGTGCLGTACNLAHAKLDEKTFEEAKKAVEQALEDLKTALAIDTNATVHRIEDSLQENFAQQQREMAELRHAIDSEHVKEQLSRVVLSDPEATEKLERGLALLAEPRQPIAIGDERAHAASRTRAHKAAADLNTAITKCPRDAPPAVHFACGVAYHGAARWRQAARRFGVAFRDNSGDGAVDAAAARGFDSAARALFAQIAFGDSAAVFAACNQVRHAVLDDLSEAGATDTRAIERRLESALAAAREAHVAAEMGAKAQRALRETDMLAEAERNARRRAEEEKARAEASAAAKERAEAAAAEEKLVAKSKARAEAAELKARAEAEAEEAAAEAERAAKAELSVAIDAVAHLDSNSDVAEIARGIENLENAIVTAEAKGVGALGIETASARGVALLEAKAEAESIAQKRMQQDDRTVLMSLFRATNGDGWRIPKSGFKGFHEMHGPWRCPSPRGPPRPPGGPRPPSPKPFDWCSDAPLGEWKGVTVDAAERVVNLTLPQSGLKGARTLP